MSRRYSSCFIANMPCDPGLALSPVELVAGRRLGRARGLRRLAAADTLAQPLEDDVEHRNDEDAERRGGEHAAEDRRADRASAGRPGAGRNPERQEPEDEGE